MIRIFAIKFDKDKECFEDEIINKFILNKNVLEIRKEFFISENVPYWSILIEYEEILEERYLKKGNKKIEKEKSGLNEWQKILFERIREWRKERANKDGIPVYIIATNSEIREIVISSSDSIEKLKLIKGFGKKKIENYGKEIITIVKTFFEKK